MGAFWFVVALLLVVMFHEAGHFLVAKAFDFKATKFFVGFGPTVWSFTRGETEYGIKLLPLGGFVKIVGMNPYEEVPEQDSHRSYPNKPKWQRSFVLLAGSGMHFVLVFVVLVITAMTLGFQTGEVSNRMLAVQNGTPAASAGIEPGDEIVGVGGERTNSWSEIRRYIRAHAGQEATFLVERDDDVREVTTTLGYGAYRGDRLVDSADSRADLQTGGEAKVVGFLGVSPAPKYETQSFAGAVPAAAGEVWAYTRFSGQQIVAVFGRVADGQVFEELGGAERNPESSPVGIVGASRVANDIVQQGQYLTFILYVCVFTIFIGVMNLLPLPPLDGGHLAVLIWEKVTGRAVDLRKLIPLAAAVIAFFTIYFIAVLYLDLARPINL